MTDSTCAWQFQIQLAVLTRSKKVLTRSKNNIEWVFLELIDDHFRNQGNCHRCLTQFWGSCVWWKFRIFHIEPTVVVLKKKFEQTTVMAVLRHRTVTVLQRNLYELIQFHSTAHLDSAQRNLNGILSEPWYSQGF